MLSSEALAITFGFSSALSWGAGDFSGGFATKHNGVLRVILFSQIIGTLLLVGLLYEAARKQVEILLSQIAAQSDPA